MIGMNFNSLPAIISMQSSTAMYIDAKFNNINISYTCNTKKNISRKQNGAQNVAQVRDLALLTHHFVTLSETSYAAVIT